jgi:transcriptional regulator with XRE-family HTH domain
VGEALRRAMKDKRLEEVDVSRQLNVDPKTVDRWLAGRVPQRRHRWALADLLGQGEHDLWPELAEDGRPALEIQNVYAHRSAVPRKLWRHILGSAQHEIGILVYAGLFLAEDVDLLRVLADRAEAGVNIRVLLGDPDGPEIAQRGHEEGIGDAMSAKIRNAMVLYKPLIATGSTEVRLHRTVLYTSIYRGDDEMLVNPHVYGVAASTAPVVHLIRTTPGGLVATYLDSFERVWETAEPLS